MTEHGLGRREAIDPRDRAHRMRWLLGPLPERRTKYWPLFFPPLDQGATSSCVGHGWKSWMLAAPTIQTRPTAEPTAMSIYLEATRLDEWEGNEGDLNSGTSVRAGAKALEARGLLAEYTWAWDVDTVADWLSVRGPVVLGTVWPRSFFTPEPSGLVRWPADSAIAGGHCYLALGWDQRRGRVRCVNSWGRWNGNGRFWVDGETLERLFAADGEAATAVEVRRL